ncbi:hypothetical protein O3P69_015223 [Scylla paramamosain]|uniref:Uncharacterized protein n=1 Tax=Scylla paramamosain TaxID=85552 RepID=A0AAW0T5P0_SCYPA
MLEYKVRHRWCFIHMRARCCHYLRENQISVSCQQFQFHLAAGNWFHVALGDEMPSASLHLPGRDLPHTSTISC